MPDNEDSEGWTAEDIARKAWWGLALVLSFTTIAFVGWHGVSNPSIDYYFPVVVQAVGPLALVGVTVAMLWVNRELATSSARMASIQEQMAEWQAPHLRCRDTYVDWEDDEPRLMMTVENSGGSPDRVERIELGVVRFEWTDYDRDGVPSRKEPRYFWQYEFEDEIVRRDNASDFRLTADEKAPFSVPLDEHLFPEGLEDWERRGWVGLVARVHGMEHQSERTGVTNIRPPDLR